MKTISADRLLDEESKQPFYLAQVEVTPDGMRLLGSNHIRPGMPASVTIKTGERNLMSYLLFHFFMLRCGLCCKASLLVSQALSLCQCRKSYLLSSVHFSFGLFRCLDRVLECAPRPLYFSVHWRETG